MFKKAAAALLAATMLCSAPVLAADGGKMIMSEAGVRFIESYEGFMSTAYLDGGVYYIGYGTAIDPADYPSGITREGAEALLRQKLSNYEFNVRTLASRAGVAFTQSQFDALVSLTYNLGAGWMKESHILYNIIMGGIAGHSDDEIVNAFGEMCHAGGRIVSGLVWRRVNEARMFLYGAYMHPYSAYASGGVPNYEYYERPGQSPDILLVAENGTIPGKLSDIKYTDWFFKFVSPLYFSGVVSGYPDGTFAPQSDITAGEALTLVLMAAGMGRQAATDSHWASGYLSLAVQKALTDPGEISDLDAPVSRLTVARLAARAVGLGQSQGQSPFADTSDGYVVALYEAGIISGSQSGSSLVFLPGDTITRAEISTVVWHLEQYVLGGL